jgi:hypothetical protein
MAKSLADRELTNPVHLVAMSDPYGQKENLPVNAHLTSAAMVGYTNHTESVPIQTSHKCNSSEKGLSSNPPIAYPAKNTTHARVHQEYATE